VCFSSHRNAKSHPVICAMGAVRDASDEEVCALIEAALSLNMRCVGANLGRTAEFTSKIVTALVTHAREHRLYTAISALPAITTIKRGGAVSSGVAKLAPQRAGAWSWDGASNKLSKLETQPDAEAQAQRHRVSYLLRRCQSTKKRG